jgi:hypothetical protein
MTGDDSLCSFSYWIGTAISSIWICSKNWWKFGITLWVHNLRSSRSQHFSTQTVSICWLSWNIYRVLIIFRFFFLLFSLLVISLAILMQLIDFNVGEFIFLNFKIWLYFFAVFQSLDFFSWFNVNILEIKLILFWRFILQKIFNFLCLWFDVKNSLVFGWIFSLRNGYWVELMNVFGIEIFAEHVVDNAS